MADDEFEDEEPDLEDAEALEEEDLVLDDDVDVDVDVEELDELEEEDEDEDLGLVPTPDVEEPEPEVEAESEDEDDVVDLEEELHPDDVEEPLDVLLMERTASERLDDEEDVELEDEELETDDRADGSTRIVPRREDEFLCRSCFLVKPLSQRASGQSDLCRDCE